MRPAVRDVVDRWAVRAAHATVIFGVILFPQLVPGDVIALGFTALIYALFALGLNIVVGWTGLLDLGAAGFVAVGAYVTAIFMTQFGWPIMVVIPVVVVAGFAAGLLLGAPTLRHRGDYFAILTLGFAELVALAIRNWPAVTRGSYGYSGIPAARLPFMEAPFSAVPPTEFYYLAAALLIPSFYAVRRLRRSQFGAHVHVIKHDENVAKSYGIHVHWHKLIAFGLSASLLSSAGFFWAAYHRSIVWNEFGVLLSCMILSALVVGGIGNPTGAVLGAAIVGTSLEIVRRFLINTELPPNTRYLLFSAALILFVLVRPQGILPDKPRWLRHGNKRDDNSYLSPHVCAPVESTDRPLLEVHDVRKTFGGIVALDSVGLSVRQGECVALIGPNGSGKSTLLNVMSGLLRPDRGSVRLSGTSIHRMATHRIARLGVGRSFQDLSVFDDISVEDNVFITSHGATRSQVIAVLEALGLPDGNASCTKLSYGEQKLLDLARLFVQPEYVRIALLDEPTAGLSDDEVGRMARMLVRLYRESGIAMIIVSHDMKFLDALGIDRVISLNQGEVLKEGSFAEIQADPDVRRLFWGDTETVL